MPKGRVPEVGSRPKPHIQPTKLARQNAHNAKIPACFSGAHEILRRRHLHDRSAGPLHTAASCGTSCNPAWDKVKTNTVTARMTRSDCGFRWPACKIRQTALLNARIAAHTPVSAGKHGLPPHSENAFHKHFSSAPQTTAQHENECNSLEDMPTSTARFCFKATNKLPPRVPRHIRCILPQASW